MTTLYNKLSENWEDYEERKRAGGGDPSLFSCDEAWEVFYLAKKINTLLPEVTEITILETIASGCRHRESEADRRQFLHYVLHALQLQLKQAG
jgi:hypothetical protein